MGSTQTLQCPPFLTNVPLNSSELEPGQAVTLPPFLWFLRIHNTWHHNLTAPIFTGHLNAQLGAGDESDHGSHTLKIALPMPLGHVALWGCPCWDDNASIETVLTPKLHLQNQLDIGIFSEYTICRQKPEGSPCFHFHAPQATCRLAQCRHQGVRGVSSATASIAHKWCDLGWPWLHFSLPQACNVICGLPWTLQVTP